MGYHHYHHGSHILPIELFNKPTMYRITAWIWPIALVSFIALIVILISGNSELFMGVAIVGFICLLSIVMTTVGCYQVGSAKYIQLPCRMSQQEVELIKQDCTARSQLIMTTFVQPVIYGMQPNMVQQIQPQTMNSQNSTVTYNYGVQLNPITSPI
ncbi:Hypothetical_protein [Hexamita inflata]|uniref:Hypothetical_protein n=1 Tax=Hexamita inflata TaxID=28002 RepID=A0AA86QAM7_9EUKA|nr:Hypothetical protein HINF_LOCUS40182 [Hexamita inflata]